MRRGGVIGVPPGATSSWWFGANGEPGGNQRCRARIAEDDTVGLDLYLGAPNGHVTFDGLRLVLAIPNGPRRSPRRMPSSY
jgi:hypothetical protein